MVEAPGLSKGPFWEMIGGLNGEPCRNPGSAQRFENYQHLRAHQTLLNTTKSQGGISAGVVAWAI